MDDGTRNFTVDDFRRFCTDPVAILFRNAFTMGPQNWLHYRIAESHQDEVVRLLREIEALLRTAPVVDLRCNESARLDPAVQAVIQRASDPAPIRGPSRGVARARRGAPAKRGL